MKGRERAIVNQTNIGTVSKATLRKLLRDGLERIIMSFPERIDTVLNGTELNWTCGLQAYCSVTFVVMTVSG